VAADLKGRDREGGRKGRMGGYGECGSESKNQNDSLASSSLEFFRSK